MTFQMCKVVKAVNQQSVTRYEGPSGSRRIYRRRMSPIVDFRRHGILTGYLPGVTGQPFSTNSVVGAIFEAKPCFEGILVATLEGF